MTWLRFRYSGPYQLSNRISSFNRFYVDAVSSDGRLYRAGVDDTTMQQTAEQMVASLDAQLDYFLTAPVMPKQVGTDYGLGEQGWIEK